MPATPVSAKPDTPDAEGAERRRNEVAQKDASPSKGVRAVRDAISRRLP